MGGELAVRLIKRKEHGTKTVRNAFPTNDVFHDQKVIFKESLKKNYFVVFSIHIFITCNLIVADLVENVSQFADGSNWCL